jgi:hypothetical protein
MSSVIALDFETYYDRDFSLSKISTEEYVRSDKFETIGVSVKFDNGSTQWYPQPEVVPYLASVDWSDKFIIAQNTAFDGAILKWRYGVNPKGWLDTLGMSRALYPHAKSHSLKSQAERHGIGVKGTEVINALGKRYMDFSPIELERYAEYCCNDTELTYALFNTYMGMGFPRIELQLIDLTLRMFIDPVLQLDKPVLQSHLAEVKEIKANLLDNVRDMMLADGDPDYTHQVFSEGTEGIKKLLMSNDKFAEVLRRFGVEPPTKISLTTGKTAYAFAKTDEDFKALEEHPSLEVQGLVAARLGNKSTLEETRTERFIGMADRGEFPVPLRYYGAHSGRWSGQDFVNLQNLPSRGANAGKIKKAIIAPPGHVVIDCDSSQIEARTLAWLAGQDDLIQAFENKEDVYKIMASRIYNVPVSEITPNQRQVGKVAILGCFGPDTLVLTMRGWVPIIQVRAMDRVWDGLTWVSHGGVVPQGEKDVWTKYGVSATLDHEILTERGWAVWSEVCENPQTLQSARAVANLLSLSGAHIRPQGEGALDGTLFVNVHAGGSASFYGRTLARAVALGAILAPKLRLILNGIGSMKAYVQTKLLGHGYLTGFHPVSPDAIPPVAKCSLTTGVEGFMFMNRGERIGSPFSRTCYPSRGMTSKVLSLTGLMWIKDMSRAIFASWGVQSTWQIGAVSEQCRTGSLPLKQRMQTYDIAYAGRRNRYTILTTEGPIVVHNCGYGVGHVKLQAFLKQQAKVEVTLEEAKRIIDAYRATYFRIPMLWKSAGNALKALALGQAMQIDIPGIVKVVPNKGLTLPNGLFIQYPDLKRVITKSLQGEEKQQWSYQSKGLPVYVYGGKVVENFCQAVARCVVAEQMLRIAKRYKVVLTVHDAIAVIVKQEEAAEAKAYIEACMSWRPKWAPGLPLACESGMGASYGDC